MSWRRLGASCGRLGGSWGSLEASLGPLRRLLEHLNPSWRRLSEVLRRFEASSRPLGWRGPLPGYGGGGFGGVLKVL